MRIVIDLQGAQTESRLRGIGRYSLSLVLAMARQNTQHELIIVLNGQIPSSIQNIHRKFKNVLPHGSIHIWNAPEHLEWINPDNHLRHQVAELIREAYIKSFDPDVILITSFFEGYGDDAVTSIKKFDQETPAAIILYDLIPLINPDKNYKNNIQLKKFYESKIKNLKKADLLLGISESACNEAITELNYPPENIKNISGAYDPKFKRIDITSSQKNELYKKFGLQKNYILYTGGADERKNLEALIQAYSKLPNEIIDKYQLVFAGSMPEIMLNIYRSELKKAGLKKDRLILTGYVSDEDLIFLYNCCSLFVFPSLHEGFGLPPLEAMACGAVVIGSNATSLREVIGHSDAFFNPKSIESITQKIYEALTNESLRNLLQLHGQNHIKLFSWNKTAIKLLDVLEKNFEKKLSVFNSNKLNFVKTSYLSSQKLKILLIKLDHLGDFILALPAIIKIQNRYPHAEFSLLVGSWCVNIAEKNTNIKKIYVLDFFNAKSSEQPKVNKTELNSLLQTLPNDFDYAIDLRRQSDTRFIMRYINATVKIGYETSDPEINQFLSIALPSVIDEAGICTVLNNESITKQMLALIDALPNHYNDFIDIKKFQTKPSQLSGGIKIAIFPKAGQSIKEWGDDNYFELINVLSTNNIVSLLNIYLPNSNDSLKFSFNNNNKVHIHSGLNYDQLIESLSNNQIAVANNSFGSHISSYLGLLTIGIYGGHETVKEWGAPFNNSYAIFHPIGCSPCHLNLASECPHNLLCLTQIDIDSVYTKVIEACEAITKTSPDNFDLISLRTHASPDEVQFKLIQSIMSITKNNINYEDKIKLAKCIASNQRRNPIRKIIFIDTSEIVQHDAKTGIQRVVKNILRFSQELMMPHYEVIPVYANNEFDGYFKLSYIQNESDQSFSLDRTLGEPISYESGDIFLGLDLHPSMIFRQKNFLKKMQLCGVKIKFVIYDLLPVTMPDFFPKESVSNFKKWLEIVIDSDHAICISKSVANDLENWIQINNYSKDFLKISHFSLGFDFKKRLPAQTKNLKKSFFSKQYENYPTFLMVGTLEPRKGHKETLEIFSQLWLEGFKINLLVIGKKGWNVDDLISRITYDHNYGKNLLWLSNIDDIDLERAYLNSSCLIAASYGEGFGLPLIEAMQFNLPIIARDIPIFREVANNYPFYFLADSYDSFKEQIIFVLQHLQSNKRLHQIEKPELITWHDSAKQLFDITIN